MSGWVRFRAALALALLTGACTVARDGVLAPAGEVAAIQSDHLMRITLLVMIVIVPVFVFLPAVLWRYRLTRRDSDYRPDWDFSWIFEILIWGIPLLIVGLLAFSLWQTTHRIDPYQQLGQGRAEPVKVQVIGLDWKFLFIYPEQGVASVNELVVPAGREVAFTLTADGPMMAFMVPRLGSQVYAMAGMKTQLHLIADRQGDFRGLNTQFNGKHFHEQKFVLRAVSESEYRAWLGRARNAPPLDRLRYAELSRPSTVSKPLVFRSAAPGLFDEVVAKYHHSVTGNGPLRGHAAHSANAARAGAAVPAGAVR